MQIRKRDGQLENFDRTKIQNGVVAAGLDFEKAEAVAGQVEEWAVVAAEDDVVEAAAVWDKVVELLDAADPDVAASYRAYRS